MAVERKTNYALIFSKIIMLALIHFLSPSKQSTFLSFSTKPNQTPSSKLNEVNKGGRKPKQN